MEVFITVLSGTLVFVIGQLIARFIIEPIYKQRQVIGNISSAINYHAPAYTSIAALKKEKINDAHESLRELAGELNTRTLMIPYYKLLAKIKVVPNWPSITAATKSLYFLSNTVLMSVDHAPDLDAILKNESTVKDLYIKRVG